MEFRRSPDRTAPKEADSLSNFGRRQSCHENRECLRIFSYADFSDTFRQIIGVTFSRYRRNRSPLCKKDPFSQAAPSGVHYALSDGRAPMVRVDVPSCRVSS
jgi:hypothetical protein